MKHTLLLLAFLGLGAATCNAQIALDRHGKMGAELRHIARSGQPVLPARGMAGISAAQSGTTPVILRTANPARLLGELRAMGIEAQAYGNSAVTARIPVERLSEVEACKDVQLMRAPRTYKLDMDSTRLYTGADKVQAGTQLETPFTGKGVLVGVIDAGIDPGHAAFFDKDQKSRVKMYWNNTVEGSAPSASIPPAGNGDAYASGGGHGTHVANIAAGSYLGNGLYGMAPGADLYLVSSTLEEENIFNSMVAIAEYADSTGQPYVVNMSFGSNLGPHDGTSPLSLTLDQFVGDGAFISASMGNDRGDHTHASATFDAKDEAKSVLYATGSDKITYAAIYSSATDSAMHFNIRPFFYGTPRAGLAPQKVYIEAGDWNSWTFKDYAYYIDPYNDRQTFEFIMLVDSLRTQLAKMYRTQGYKYADANIGFEITALHGGTAVHTWTESGYGTIAAPSSKLGYTWFEGDDLYDVGEGPACAEHSIAVAAWTGQHSYRSIDGSTYSYNGNGYTDGAIAPFSSRGPWLGTEPKPTVAAPGVAIKSAFYTTSYSNTQSVVDKVNMRLPGSIFYKDIYFGVMSGTSMSAPVVTGAIALWLEACPSLSYEQLLEIFRTTSRRDSFTGQQWNTDFGYGKLDAYAGLKKALEMANRNGIDEVQNTPTPLTILKEAAAWRLLFNSDESFARIEVYTLSGSRVASRTLSNVRRGHEETLSLAGLTPGAYVVHVTTPRSATSRKVLVSAAR